MASPKSQRPPAPSSIDLTIRQYRGCTVALEMMPDALQASKEEPTPSLKQMIEILSRENGRLREELAYRQRLQELGEELRQEVVYVADRLKMAVVTFQKEREDIRKDFH